MREITELNNAITKTKLRTNFKIGQKINNFYEKEYGQESFKKISVHTGINTNTLYKMCQIAKEFTDDDIDLFCDGGDFPVAYKHIKAFLPLGRYLIMDAFVSAANQQDFVATLKNLHKSSRKGDQNCPVGTKSPEQPDEQFGNSDDQNDTEMQSHTDSSENKDENATATDSHNKETGGDNSKETVPNEDSVGGDNFDNGSSASSDNKGNNDEGNAKVGTKNKPTVTATPKPNSSKNNAIKQKAGNSLPTNPVKSAGGSINDRIGNNSKSTNDDSDTIDLVAAKLQLSALKATNKQLLERIAELETENSQLKLEIERLLSQQAEEEFDTDIDEFLQSSETEEEEELEIA